MSSKNQTIKIFSVQTSNVNQTSTLQENVSTKRPLSPNDVTDISTKKSMHDLASSNFVFVLNS